MSDKSNCVCDRDFDRVYFAAANTKDGFYSYFDDIFFNPSIKRRYIIKGGPGTGKSSFMKRVALWAQKKGLEVEYYYCSSDTSSLDGVIIDGRVAMLDGTAPHSYDTVLPGACDEIINLGDFWNASKLSDSADDITRLGAKKREHYSHAYGYLAAAGKVRETLDSIIKPCMKWDKMTAAVCRSCDKIKVTDGVRSADRICQMTALGTAGEVHFDTLLNLAKERYLVVDHYGTAPMFLDSLCRRARDVGRSVWMSLDVVDHSTPTELYFPDSGEYYGICDADRMTDDDVSLHHINMKRFVDAESFSNIRYSYRVGRQAYRSLIDLATYQLSLAGQVHGQIESFYVGAMDFSRQQRYCTELLRTLEGVLV